MPKNLTPAAIERLKPGPERREIRDIARGLHLVIQPSGTKSWALRFRRPDGKPAKLTLGSVDTSARESSDEPILGGPLTVGQARELAAKIDRERARGLDVITERKAAVGRSASTFGICAVEFVTDYRTGKHKQRPRRWREDAALLGLRYPLGSDPATTEPSLTKGGLAENWHDKPVADVDGHDVHAAVAEARKSSDNRGRKLHVVLSAMFNWLTRERRIDGNPVHGVWKPAPPIARERVLTDAEVVTFWRATEALDTTYGPLFKLLLLTGARLREASGMTRSEIVDGVWTIPGARTKNHRPLVLPLPEAVQRLLASVRQIAGSDLVFTVDGKRPANDFSHRKAALDAAMADIAGSAVPAFRLHDLRRTFASGLAALGVQLPVVERLLNHISGSFGGVAGVYQRHEFTAEKREALKRWAGHIDGLTADRRNVVRMK